MNDLVVHVSLFLLVAVVIVVCSAFYSETDDAAAFRSVPKRLAWLVFGCGALAGLLVLLEHTLAKVS